MTRSAFVLLLVGLAALLALDVIAIGRASRGRHPVVVTPGDRITLGETVILRGEVDPSRRADEIFKNGTRRVWIAVTGYAGRFAWLACDECNVPVVGPGEWRGVAVRSKTAQFTLDQRDVDQNSLPVAWSGLGIVAALLLAMIVPAAVRARRVAVDARAKGALASTLFAAMAVLAAAAHLAMAFFAGVTGRLALQPHVIAALVVAFSSWMRCVGVSADGVLLWRGWSLRARLVPWKEVVGVATARTGLVRNLRIVTRDREDVATTSRRDPFVDLLLQRTAGAEHGAVRVEPGALVVLGERIPRTVIASVGLSEDGLFVRLADGGLRFVDAWLVLNPTSLAAEPVVQAAPRRCIRCGGRFRVTASRRFGPRTQKLEKVVAALEQALAEASAPQKRSWFSDGLMLRTAKCRRCAAEATVALQGAGNQLRTLYVRHS